MFLSSPRQRVEMSLQSCCEMINFLRTWQFCRMTHNPCSAPSLIAFSACPLKLWSSSTLKTGIQMDTRPREKWEIPKALAFGPCPWPRETWLLSHSVNHWDDHRISSTACPIACCRCCRAVCTSKMRQDHRDVVIVHCHLLRQAYHFNLAGEWPQVDLKHWLFWSNMPVWPWGQHQRTAQRWAACS